MYLTIHVTAHAKQNKIIRLDATHFRIWVTAAPDKGKANAAVIRVLAEFLDVPQSRITITRGETARTKVAEVDT